MSHTVRPDCITRQEALDLIQAGNYKLLEELYFVPNVLIKKTHDGIFIETEGGGWELIAVENIG